jgi:hypothetical protein
VNRCSPTALSRGLLFSVAGPAVSSALNRMDVEVFTTVGMTLRAMRSRLHVIPRMTSSAVFAGRNWLQVVGADAASVRTARPPAAGAYVPGMAKVIQRLLERNVAVMGQVRVPVGKVPLPLQFEAGVPVAINLTGPVPASVGLYRDLLLEACREPQVAESQLSGTFGHVRLLRSRTAPRECSSTRRGPSCHFTEFPSYLRAEFLVHSGADSHKPGNRSALSSTQGEPS